MIKLINNHDDDDDDKRVHHHIIRFLFGADIWSNKYYSFYVCVCYSSSICHNMCVMVPGIYD